MSDEPDCTVMSVSPLAQVTATSTDSDGSALSFTPNDAVPASGTVTDTSETTTPRESVWRS